MVEGDCMTEIFLEIRGGVLAETYSKNRDVTVTVIDWDNIGEDSEIGTPKTLPCVSFDRMPEETLAAIGLKPRNI